MIATVVLLYKDGTTAEFGSDGRGRAREAQRMGGRSEDLMMRDGRTRWCGSRRSGPEEQPVLQPWIPDSVKVLWKPFDAGASVKSARLYATALGTYEL